ncbi:ribulose-1,5-biphosphate synthetase [Sedimentisphaera cyanobacteriorum]|uniref:Ribulose-1,5-biphosphate synthetase n=1 Tax=Sedimentisphaera cyanobacteriorum TaxID=1940790 RepID=A0A1Q2HSQ2_9BACT|nr:FAD-dependent oxidoreductase [Sedimentisphaera cyanobacteriorum]AQQ10265.1 ribulose-1,5-biphosphate synthetase [Sedimentisphaera cyanobacteriorum]
MFLKYSKSIPIKYDVDVFIGGGGPAGIAAGATAAKSGASTFLAESHTCLGGMGTAGLVPLFMNFCDGKNFLAGGFGKDIYNAVIDSGGVKYNRYLSIKAEPLKRIYDRIAAESGLKLTFQTNVVDAVAENEKFNILSAAPKAGYSQ